MKNFYNLYIYYDKYTNYVKVRINNEICKINILCINSISNFL